MILLVLPYRLKHIKLSKNYMCWSELVTDVGRWCYVLWDSITLFVEKCIWQNVRACLLPWSIVCFYMWSESLKISGVQMIQRLDNEYVRWSLAQVVRFWVFTIELCF